MADIVGLGEALKSKVAEKAYDDAFSKPAKQLGEFSEDVLKTLRLMLFPFQIGATVQDKLNDTFKRAVDKVPSERRIVPQLQIVGPIYEHIKYMDENSILYELFEELLARSIDFDRIAEAQPAFINIISQLSRDEAIILLLLKDTHFDYVLILTADRGTSRVIDKTIDNCTFPRDRLLIPNNFEMYIDHLETLGLVKAPEIEKNILIADEHQDYRAKISLKIHLTKFGEFFINACVPENGFRNK